MKRSPAPSVVMCLCYVNDLSHCNYPTFIHSVHCKACLWGVVQVSYSCLDHLTTAGVLFLNILTLVC